tara:strand:+ start:1188 stop:1556 length:369 start_codon:yes stop_codon:yes gene_type:complete
MPSQRKRIGFLPSEEVHEIIDKLCRANDFSQSKITGLLVEEALRARGVLRDSLSLKSSNSNNLSNDLFEKESLSKNKNTPRDTDVYTVNKELFIEDMKMIHEFIEFKYFKRVMNKNKNIFDE